MKMSHRSELAFALLLFFFLFNSQFSPVKLLYYFPQPAENTILIQ